MSTGLKLSLWLPNRRLLPLKENEVRYFQDVTTDFGTSKRSCIFNELTGRCHIEIPDNYIDGKLMDYELHASLDRGSIGKPVSDVLLLKIGLDMCVDFDPWHIFDTTLKAVDVDTGVHFDKLSASVAYNVFRGPWFLNIFWSQFQGSVAEQNAYQYEDDLIFDAFFPWHCKLNNISVEQAADRAFKNDIRSQVKSASCYRMLRAHTKFGRWNAFPKRHEEVKKDRALLGMGLVKMGVRSFRAELPYQSIPCTCHSHRFTPFADANIHRQVVC